ncbi:MAG: hypothetical protein ACRCZS_25350, partial [Chroococcidiopsis sp.]
MANPYYTKPRIYFGEYQQTLPQWSGTPQHQPKVLLPGGGHLNASAFTASSSAAPITVAAAGAAAGSTTIPLQSAIASSIPSGKILDFTGAGKFAKLTLAAIEGSTSLTVEALPQALVSGDMTYYSTGDYLYIQSGTLVGRTYAERDAGIGYGPADTATDEEVFLLFFDVHNALLDNECELYMKHNVIYENFLPNW